MRQVIINGKPILVPSDQVSGRELKSLGAIPANRQLIKRGGGKSELVTDGQVIPVSDGDYFGDAPFHEYGG